MKFSSKTIFFMVLLLLSASFLYNGCSDDDVTGPSNNITQLNANGSIAQVSRTEATGTMFVTDQNGAPVTGITSSNVVAKLSWTNDEEVTGTVTVTTGQASGLDLAAATTMDYSGSMGDPQIDCMEAGVGIFINSMNTGDVMELIKFATTVEVVQPFTSNKTELWLADTSYWPGTGGTTALYQSIYEATDDVNGQPGSQYIRAVVAFTDGGENASTVSRDEMIEQAMNYGIPVYTIGLYDSLTNIYGGEAQDLRNIADTTGGFYFWSDYDQCSNLNTIYQTISGQLANAYSLNINWPASNLPPAGTPVTVTITVNFAGLTTSFSRIYLIQ